MWEFVLHKLPAIDEVCLLGGRKAAGEEGHRGLSTVPRFSIRQVRQGVEARNR